MNRRLSLVFMCSPQFMSSLFQAEDRVVLFLCIDIYDVHPQRLSPFRLWESPHNLYARPIYCMYCTHLVPHLPFECMLFCLCMQCNYSTFLIFRAAVCALVLSAHLLSRFTSVFVCPFERYSRLYSIKTYVEKEMKEKRTSKGVKKV